MYVTKFNFYPPEGLTGFLRPGRPEKEKSFVHVCPCESVARKRGFYGYDS